MRRTVIDTLPTIIGGWRTQGGTVLRRSTTLVVTALVTGALLSAPSSAASDTAQTCQGRPATIVGTGPAIQGTPGDDVIVTGTSQRTYAVAGNDLVCVSPSAILVYAGDGDDVVDASEAGVVANVYLGAGLDRYVGGPDQENDPNNVVFADGTDDTVTDADRAYLTVTAPVTGTPGTYTGDVIAVWSADHDVEIDLDTNMVTVGGVHAANLTGIVDAGVVAPRAVLRGNAEDNYLFGSGCDVLFVGKGGNDTLRGSYNEDSPYAQIKSECEGMKATMRGGPGDDNIQGWQGRNRLVGNAGNDELQGRARSDVLLGGSGRDDLRGGEGSDVLRGGRGRDTADGQYGRDRCDAERERRCER
jgi:Ca2+-binding RTX toxin-like protein